MVSLDNPAESQLFGLVMLVAIKDQARLIMLNYSDIINISEYVEITGNWYEFIDTPLSISKDFMLLLHELFDMDFLNDERSLAFKMTNTFRDLYVKFGDRTEKYKVYVKYSEKYNNICLFFQLSGDIDNQEKAIANSIIQSYLGKRNIRPRT